MDVISKKAANTEAITYSTEMATAVTNAKTGDAHLEGLCSQIRPLAQQMSDNIAIERANALTAVVDDRDEVRDNNLSAYILFLKAYLMWDQDTTRDAAKRQMRIVQNHGGNFGKESREIESGLYNSLLNELAKPENKADVETLKLTELVAQMKTAQQAFEEAYQQWSASAESKQDYVAPWKIKKELLAATDVVVNYLDAMQKANSAVYKSLALQVDQMTVTLNQKIKQRNATKPTPTGEATN